MLRKTYPAAGRLRKKKPTRLVQRSLKDQLMEMVKRKKATKIWNLFNEMLRLKLGDFDTVSLDIGKKTYE